jgi:hypothetical protein
VPTTGGKRTRKGTTGPHNGITLLAHVLAGEEEDEGHGEGQGQTTRNHKQDALPAARPHSICTPSGRRREERVSMDPERW